jgi:hypothetical protein
MALRQKATSGRNDMVEYATLDLGAADLEAQGLALDESWVDGLGPAKAAIVVLSSGVEVALVSYTNAPKTEVVVMAPMAVDGPVVASELADELGLPRERITWLRATGIDWSQFGSAPDVSGPS